MRTTALLICAVLCLSFSAHAQETETPSRTIFKLSPQHFIRNSLKAGIERFNENHSGSVAFFVTGMMAQDQNSFRDQYNGLAGELQLRKYISPMKSVTSRNDRVYSQGVYGAAYLQGGSYSGNFKEENHYTDPTTGNPATQVLYDYKENVGNWGFGFTLGYQKTLWQVIFLEAFVGGGVQFSDRTVSGFMPNTYYFGGDDGIVDPAFRGILPKIGIHIGIGL